MKHPQPYLDFPAWQASQYQEILAQITRHIPLDQREAWLGHPAFSPQSKFHFFLQQFRVRFQKGEQKPLLRDLAFALYTSRRMEDALSTLLGTLLQRKQPEKPMSIDITLQCLPHDYKKLYSLQHQLGLSWWKRMRWGYEGIALWKSLDLHLQASFPYVAFCAGSTTFLRMSTPTRGSNGAPKLQEEFLAYLEALQERNSRHLYINLQDRRHSHKEAHYSWRGFFKSVGFQEEAYRCAHIEALGAQFPGTVSVMTLDKDSLFYHQKGVYGVATVPVKTFQAAFLAQMFEMNSSGFFWDASLLQNGVRERCERLLEAVQAEFFPRSFGLSPKERRIYIEIFYTKLIREISQDFTYVNISCKDSIDRAGGTLGLLYFFLLQEAAPEAQLEHWASVLFGPALIVKQRALFFSRFSRFYEAACYVRHF